MRINKSGQEREVIIQRAQVESLLAVLFEPSDLIELRAIETWTESGKKFSRPVDRTWLTADEIIEQLPRLERLNGFANIFFGVNPRHRKGGTKGDVAECRCIWVDLDNVTLAEATGRWDAIQIPPTVIVNSGHGVHAYFRLVTPVSVRDPVERSHFEGIVKGFSTSLGGDATQDCSRMLRLPGTLNVKDRRNGIQPVRCDLIEVEESRVYPISAFDRWVSTSDSPAVPQATDRECSMRDVARHVPLCSATIGGSRDHRRIQGLIRYLDTEQPDRSRRDFSVVCGLLELGLDDATIWEIVKDKSKFAEAGRPYFRKTVENALKRLDQASQESTRK